MRTETDTFQARWATFPPWPDNNRDGLFTDDEWPALASTTTAVRAYASVFGGGRPNDDESTRRAAGRALEWMRHFGTIAETGEPDWTRCRAIEALYPLAYDCYAPWDDWVAIWANESAPYQPYIWRLIANRGYAARLWRTLESVSGALEAASAAHHAAQARHLGTACN